MAPSFPALPVPALGQLLGLSTGELLIILVIVLLLFGATKIPELARNLGKAKAEFKRGEVEGKRAVEQEEEEAALRKRAGELGIRAEGLSLDELRREVAKRS